MRYQRTIKNPVTLKGKGIHSGDDVTLTIKNAPADTGIIFFRSDLKQKPAIAANVSNLADYSGDLRCTSLEKNGTSINTIEHLMAALSNLNIDNAAIEIDNQELPAMDGGALDYTLNIKKAGILEQDKEKKEFYLREAVWCREGDALLTAVPSESLNISYLLKYDGLSYMTQCADFSFASIEEREELFTKEIAPARTFCLEKELAHILERGLGKGGDYKNSLVLNAQDGNPVGNEFKFINEPARHKVVDLLGDLALLGADIKAHIIGIRSGHSLNKELLKKLEKRLHAE
ncbi:MAG: UDP-3-O-[3-hydroxymyristoyl] N-acetylglucosamine deacetylase [Candidatus Omnitrophica bacterium]|nr:UDP-3-O-[3-hydroxymyristoyl] N-acetylglucosamine deacetylase [Candidatus Omnitrophota bacterium]